MGKSADRPEKPEHRNNASGSDGESASSLQYRLAELQRINRALRLLSSVNQAMLHATTEADLIRETCEIAVDEGKYLMAWVGFVEHDAAHTVRPICHAGHDEGYLREARISWADNELGRGPTGTAIRTNQPTAQADIANAPEYAPWREAALQRGYRSGIAFPLRIDDQVFGSITLYGDVPNAFSPDEIKLLSEMAGDLSYGISALRTRQRHQQAEQALRASEEKFSKAFYTSPDAININRLADGVYLDISKSFTEITGYTRDEVIGHTSLAGGIEIWVNPEDRQRLMAALREHGEIRGLETEFRCKDGRILNGLMSATLIVLNGEQCVLSTTRDITELKQAEEELRKREERYRILYNAISDGIVVHYRGPQGEPGTFIDVNDVICRRLGYSREEMLRMSPKDIDAPDSGYDITPYLREVSLGHEATFEQIHVTKDGRRIPVEIHACPFMFEGIPAVLSLVRDITERKQSEESLRLTQFSVDNAADMIFWLDFEGRIIYVNHASCVRLGYSQDELQRMTVFDIDPLFTREIWLDSVENLRREQARIIITEHKAKSGEIYPVEISTYYLSYGGKEFSCAFVRDITERKRAEEERERLYAENKAQRVLFETIVNDAPVGIVLLEGPEHRYVLVNPAYLPLISGKGEIVGRAVAEVFPEIASTVVPLLDKVYNTGEPYSASEMPLTLMREGKPDSAFISFTYTPWRDAKGNIQGVLVLASETTEQVRARQEIEKERALLRTVLSALPVGVFIVDATGRFVNINEAVNRVWGGDAPMAKNVDEYALYSGWWEDTGKPIEAEEWAAARAVIKGETSVGEIINIRRFDNTFGTIINSAVPLRDAEGNITGAVVVIQDITDLKQAEDTIKRERAFLASAIELLPFPIFFASTDQTIFRTNQACREFLHEDGLDQWWAITLLDPNTREPIANRDIALTRMFKGEPAPPSREVTMDFPDGREMPALLYMAPIAVGEESIAAVIAFQDITALKEADRAKDQFLMVLSHEIKTPLTNIIGWAQLAESESDIVPEALVTILRNAHEQKILLERLIILSRILTGKLALLYKPTDLWQLALKVEQRFRQAAEERNITLSMEPPAGELLLEADGKLLEQAIFEVIDNAMNFTPAGGNITVQGRRENGGIALTVQDTGQGIAPERLSTLSKPFTQIQRREEVGGIGIGLALVRGIVEAHGGRVTINSAGAEQGTTVTLWLPS